ncbi:15219_t:CDS:2 [Funneliformis geosporum]|uniref:15219_t:CDS:1 n=1 Tax=Funneliformis geosporum TaxID=1117311 RepID=A0A9W4STP6_9GLOM|nr:15219_t:CDS:2 [Funneliformis geosporum]
MSKISDNAIDHSGLIVELDNTKRLLEFNQLEIQQKLKSRTDFNNQITQLQQQLKDQRIEIEELKKQLQKLIRI